jgi:hypothetical protein
LDPEAGSQNKTLFPNRQTWLKLGRLATENISFLLRKRDSLHGSGFASSGSGFATALRDC